MLISLFQSDTIVVYKIYSQLLNIIFIYSKIPQALVFIYMYI